MRYFHDQPDLPINAFRKIGVLSYRPVTLEGGKGSAPPAPDYRSAAEETARGNLEAAKYATQANRINQYTPWGSLTYTRKPTGSLNTSAYNAALDRYYKNLEAYNSGQPQSSNDLSLRGRIVSGAISGAPQNGAGGPPVRPKEEDFMTQGEQWEQYTDLTPEAQAALDEQLALNRKYGEVANLGFDRARRIFENPELDVSGLPTRGINVGQTAQDAILARLRPQLQAQEEATRQRLANTGIGLGSDAFSREMAMQNQQANDLMTQAAMQGISLDQANRAAALQEQAYLQDRPLNLINALRSGNQVQAPQFQQFALQNATQGPDYLNAANAQYGAQLNAYNAEQASSPLGGIFGLGMGIAGLPMKGGASIGGSFLGKKFPGLFGP
jgi:hypothetical protein